MRRVPANWKTAPKKGPKMRYKETYMYKRVKHRKNRIKCLNMCLIGTLGKAKKNREEIQRNNNTQVFILYENYMSSSLGNTTNPKQEI